MRADITGRAPIPAGRAGPHCRAVRILLTAVRDELVWIDCEMTGLDLESDRLIEIAVLVTDAELNLLGDGLDVVIHADDAALDGMVDVVATMHRKSGLTEEVRASTDRRAHRGGDGPRLHPRATSSSPTPRRWRATRSPPTAAFIARDMPALDDYLHYRMIDVSSIKELCRRWYPRIYFGQPEKGLAHRALADIHESIRELKYYRQHRLRRPARPRDQRHRRGRRRTRPAADDARQPIRPQTAPSG